MAKKSCWHSYDKCMTDRKIFSFPFLYAVPDFFFQLQGFLAAQVPKFSAMGGDSGTVGFQTQYGPMRRKRFLNQEI